MAGWQGNPALVNGWLIWTPTSKHLTAHVPAYQVISSDVRTGRGPVSPSLPRGATGPLLLHSLKEPFADLPGQTDSLRER